MDVEPERSPSSTRSTIRNTSPSSLKVPGVVSVARFKKQEVTLLIGGERKTVVFEEEPGVQRHL